MKGVHGVDMTAIEWERMVPQIAEQAKILPPPVFSRPIDIAPIEL